MALGRPPKPTILKELAGNPGKRPANTREPKPRSDTPRMPAHLSDPARVEWKRLMREFKAMKLLKSVDADALAMYCETYARWVDASQQLAEVGMVSMTENGYPVMSPYVAIINQCMRTMKALLTEFGMTPASRSRLQVPVESEEDEFDRFLRDG